MKSKILDELSLYLRPPGQGVYAVSTGKAELEAATRSYLGKGTDPTDWREHLNGLQENGRQVVLLALPCDTGAGIVRGASRGPEGIRAQLKTSPVFDLGDVFVIPHVLDDEMCSESFMGRARNAIYPQESRPLPVAPLSILRKVYELLHAFNPEIRVLLLGGDHSVTWPAMDVLLSGGPQANSDVGIVHFDAHTDLLSERLGTRFCFATWAYHANELLGRGERLIQIGIRASGKTQSFWEKELGVRQIWAQEALALSPDALGEKVVEHLRSKGLKRIFVSNDIDGTDSKWAAACGTPEAGGLTPDHVHGVLSALKAGDFECFGADMVELAPGLSLSQEASEASCRLAAGYVRAELELLQK